MTQKKPSARQWYTAKTENQMTASQKVWFQKSYNSYLKNAEKKEVPEGEILTTSGYFSEYKMTRRELQNKGKDVSNLPRYIATEQTYERSIYQDKAQYNIFKDNEKFKEKFGELSFRGYRKLKQSDLDDFIFNEINKKRKELESQGKDANYISHFISKEFFGSP